MQSALPAVSAAMRSDIPFTMAAANIHMNNRTIMIRMIMMPEWGLEMGRMKVIHQQHY
jgi:hypothetical protein